MEQARLESFLDGLTPDELDAAEYVRRMPGATQADIHIYVEQYRLGRKVDEGFKRLEQHLQPPWKTALQGLGIGVGSALAALAAFIEVGPGGGR